MIFSYFMVYKPFLEIRRRYFTICAWSGRIKVDEQTWLKSEDFLLGLGANITHGISPEEKLKLDLKRKGKQKV